MLKPKQREALVEELRTLSDRLEDGEYAVTDLEIDFPGAGEKGRFSFEMMSDDDYERMGRVFK